MSGYPLLRSVKALGHFVSDDGSSNVGFAELRRRILGSAHQLVKGSFLQAGVNTRYRLLLIHCLPHIRFLAPSLVLSKSQIDNIDSLQSHVIRIAFPVKRDASFSSDAEYFRCIRAGKAGRAAGRWSVVYASSFVSWHEHCKRATAFGNTWVGHAASSLAELGDVVDRNRLFLASGGRSHGTGTRVAPARPATRYNDCLQMCITHAATHEWDRSFDMGTFLARYDRNRE